MLVLCTAAAKLAWTVCTSSAENKHALIHLSKLQQCINFHCINFPRLTFLMIQHGQQLILRWMTHITFSRANFEHGCFFVLKNSQVHVHTCTVASAHFFVCRELLTLGYLCSSFIYQSKPIIPSLSFRKYCCQSHIWSTVSASLLWPYPR